MSDIEYQFGDVPNRYQDVIQRMAVLYTLRGMADGMDDVRAKTAEVLMQWRARIGALTTAGWEPHRSNGNSHSIMYARNCKPTFAMSDLRTRTCNCRAICPFCYARQVRKIWLAIDADFPAPDPVEQPCDPESGRELRSIILDVDPAEPERQHTSTFRFHLVERHHSFVRPVIPTDGAQLSLPQTLIGLLDNIEASRTELVRLVDPVGAFLYTTLEPCNDGREWLIHHRQLFKMLPTQILPESVTQATAGHIHRYDRPTRKTILRAVANVCRYPVGLMVGSPERTAQLLAIRRDINFRGYASFRSFRNTTEYD